MRALIINKFGPPEVLTLSEILPPECQESKVLVKIRAAALNPVDYKIRNGSIWFLSGRKFPKILGGDIAGVVEKVPPGSRFSAGEKVYAMLDYKGGGYAEYACIAEDWICKMPANLSFNEAAAIPLAGLTALQALRDLGGIEAGKKVLINGASGGVGHLAVQIANYFGAEVTAVCSGKNIEWVKSLGVSRVIDYQKEDVTTIPYKFDIVFDAVATLSPRATKRILNDKGVFVSTLPGPGIILQSIFSMFSSKKYKAILAKPLGADLALLTKMAEEQALKPVIEKVYSLDEGVEAHRHLETSRVKGKLVFNISE
jgi:NADPH:quinone reductase-like Zn-dependent oxidoreductase